MSAPLDDHHLAEQLQRILLPRELPDVPGWAAATLYQPAGDTVLVGGDFYDWFVLPNRKVVFLLGDVSGKGPRAGALGMSIRKAIKGIAWMTGDTLLALPILEQALADEFGHSFATLCVVEVTPGCPDVRMILAGHPRPLLRHGTGFCEVAAPGNALLGPRLAPRWVAHDLHLEDQDSLLTFSDGLTDARLPDGRYYGEGPMQERLASMPPRLSSLDTVLLIDQHMEQLGVTFSDDLVLSVLTYRSG